MSFKIEEGIPAPARRVVTKGYTAAIRELKRGQSVLLPTTYGSAYSLCAALCQYERKPGEFIVRPEGKGARVWRVDPKGRE